MSALYSCRMRRERLILPTKARKFNILQRWRRTQGPIRHADCRQRKLADFLCTGGIIQGLISVAHQAFLRLPSVSNPRQ
ncbi:hypothetical protein EQ819_05765 [Escherichia coli]|nr:hypothetical protein EQ819_05765 [Escherichia coli]